MKYINFEELEIFHNKIIKSTGGSKGIRDKIMIEEVVIRAGSRSPGEIEAWHV